jgi:hypothetical protein
MHEYSVRGGVNGQLVEFTHGPTEDWGAYFSATVIDSYLVIEKTYFSPSDTSGEVFVAPVVLEPGVSDPGAPTASYIVDMTSTGTWSKQGPIFPVAGNTLSNFKTAVLWWNGSTPSSPFEVSIISSDGSQGLYHAFETPSLQYAASPDIVAHCYDANKNYTYMTVYDGQGHHFLTEWIPNSSLYNYANFNIQLSDSADNTKFQGLSYSFPGNSAITSNGSGLVFTFNGFANSEMTAFVFNPEMTFYDKYVLTYDSEAISDAVMFIDSTGGKWLTGYDNANGDMYSVFLSNQSGPTVIPRKPFLFM